MNMLQVDGVWKTFAGLPLFENISFSVSEGEAVSIMGAGGSGKSTLLKLILGLEPVDEGAIHLLNTNMTQASDQEKENCLRKVGVAFQQGALFDSMTVADNIRFAIDHMTKMTIKDREQRIKELLLAVKLPNTASLYPHELSGGMKRRIGIARALAIDPVVGFFDEPSSGLDPVTSSIIIEMIHSLGRKREKNTLLIFTSSVELAIRFAPRMILLKDGQIEADDNWKNILLNGSDWAQHFLGTRLVGIDMDYARQLDLPQEFFHRKQKTRAAKV